MLRNGLGISGGFEKIGTKEGEEDEVPPIEEYITYDEMQISSMISVASPTYFINRVKKKKIHNFFLTDFFLV